MGYSGITQSNVSSPLLLESLFEWDPESLCCYTWPSHLLQGSPIGSTELEFSWQGIQGSVVVRLHPWPPREEYTMYSAACTSVHTFSPLSCSISPFSFCCDASILILKHFALHGNKSFKICMGLKNGKTSSLSWCLIGKKCISNLRIKSVFQKHS